MREILFRGMKMYDKEWGYGFLVKLGKESFSDPERYGITDKGIPLFGSGVCYNFEIDEVIPETVGQYTGLTDKNGKKIFEGDIVLLDGDCEELYTVAFDECCFQASSETVCYVMDNFYNHDLEVVGNIHDNPELLKGEKK